MALELNLTKNTNESILGTYGKYYPRVEYKGTMNTLELAKHMASHTTSFSKGEINGMLTDLVSCIKELCLLGYVVKIDDLGLFKASVEGNGLTLKKGAKVSAGVGSQRTDEEIVANVAVQQSAISAVKLIMQATGETTMDQMTRDASTSFTSKTKQLIKQLTGNDASDGEGGEPAGGNDGGETTNQSQNSGSQSGSQNNGGGSQSGGSQSNALAAPTISGNTSFTESTQVTMSGPDGAEIHYTTDGSAPSSASALYSEAITLTNTATVKAIAIKDGVSSEVTSKTFVKSSGDDDGE